MRNLLITIAISLALSACFRERKLRKEAEIIIEKVNNYKKINGKVPPNLTAIGIKESEEGPIYYTAWKDSVNYIIYYSSGGVGESEKYYSDSNQWESIDRGIR